MALINTNNATILPVRVSDEDLQRGRYRLRTPERVEQHTIPGDTAQSSPPSSPPASSPVKSTAAASNAQSATLSLSTYLNASESADSLLTLDWNDLLNDRILIVASTYTTDEFLTEINNLRHPPLPPVTKRQAHQKISAALTMVAKRNGIKREDLKTAFEKARVDSGYYQRLYAARDDDGEDGGEMVKAPPGRDLARKRVDGRVNEAGGKRLKKFRMVIDRKPARKWERKKVEVRSFVGGEWEMKTWQRD